MNLDTAQQAFAGMPRRLYTCTPTRLTTWLDCPRRYRLTYLDRPAPPKGPPWAHNSVGAAVHGALAGWWRLELADRTPAAAGRLLDAGWLPDGFRDEEQETAARARGREMVERYTATLDPRDEPVGVERTVATRTDALAVSGRVDRIDLRPRGAGPDADPPLAGAGEGTEELVVVDYKTGRHALDTTDARGSLALALYALAATRVLRKPCHRVELHHLPTGDVVVWEHTEQTLARHLRRAESIAAEAAAADLAYRGGLPGAALDQVFPPRTGPGCAWCDLSRHCPEGRAAAAPKRPWDGLPTLTP
jgi:RecB family exonuclease